MVATPNDSQKNGSSWRALHIPCCWTSLKKFLWVVFIGHVCPKSKVRSRVYAQTSEMPHHLVTQGNGQDLICSSWLGQISQYSSIHLILRDKLQRSVRCLSKAIFSNLPGSFLNFFSQTDTLIMMSWSSQKRKQESSMKIRPRTSKLDCYRKGGQCEHVCLCWW